MEKLVQKDGIRVNVTLLDDISKIVFDNIRNVALCVLVSGSGVLDLPPEDSATQN